jgi:hypothetical protein
MNPGAFQTTPVRPRFTSRRALPLICVLMTLWCAEPVQASEVSAVELRLGDAEMHVTASLKPDAKSMEDLARGLTKEINFYIDLFRVWSLWPNEFVLGRKIVRSLKSDPIKREYVATSAEGNVQTEKRFRNLDSMVEWALTLNDIQLTPTAGLEPGEYFVKVSVESFIRKLPPVIGYLLFFVPEKEFSLSRNSTVFHLPAGGAPK